MDELAELKKQLEEGLASGKIKKDTEEYFELLKKIQEVENEIDNLDASIIEFSNNLSEQYRKIFDSLANEFEAKLGQISHYGNMLNNSLSITEEKGYMISEKYYEAMRANEYERMAMLREEREQLEKALFTAVASGEIQVGSQAWYEMRQQIDGVTESIQQSELAVAQLTKKIREAKWEAFDFLEAEISRLTSESNFLIDLMSNKNLYTDNGQLTNEGMATMGLRGVNYNTLMRQADDYAKEILALDSEIANDPANVDLIKRREELLDLQQKSIIAAENEKQAIKNLVKDGIQKELSYLKELISGYTKALDNAKDLYDYQKNIAKQTKEIANLEKQLTAFGGDTSEETKATVQKIKVELEEARENLQETEYDHFVSETKKLLDNLYSNYETTLNTRLDNMDALIADMVQEININAVAINTTLNNAANAVGYTMTNTMSGLWSEAAQMMNASNADRVRQTSQILSQLVANGQISQTDANRILTALGNGDAQGIINARNVITELEANGSITQSQGNLLRQSVSGIGNDFSERNNAGRVQQTQQLLAQMVADGRISQEDANRVLTALGKGDAQGVINAGNIIQQLVAEGKISSQDAGDIKRMMNSTTEGYHGVVTQYGADFSNKWTATNNAIKTIETNVKTITDKAIKEAEAAAAQANADKARAEQQAREAQAQSNGGTKVVANQAAGNTSTAPTHKTNTTTPANSELKSTNTAGTVAAPGKDFSTTGAAPMSTQGDGTVQVGDKVKYVSGEYYYSSTGASPLGHWYRGQEVYVTMISPIQGASHPYLIGIENSYDKSFGWVSKSQISGYASGLRRSSRGENAWVNELGTEAILSPTENAIITHINRGDSVLNAEATKNIWDMANDPSAFINGHLFNMPTGDRSEIGGITNNFDNAIGEIVLPNVKDYDDFLAEMQKDKRFEKLITAIAVDPLMGKSKELKHRFNF